MVWDIVSVGDVDLDVLGHFDAGFGNVVVVFDVIAVFQPGFEFAEAADVSADVTVSIFAFAIVDVDVGGGS